MFKILFPDSPLCPKQLSLFCLLWLSSASADRVASLAFLTPNFTNLAFFRGSWRQQKLFGILAFSFQYLAILEAIGTYNQTGVLTF